jgi:hypothetical protein
MGLRDNEKLRGGEQVVYAFTNRWRMAYSMAWLRSQTCSIEKMSLTGER